MMRHSSEYIRPVLWALVLGAGFACAPFFQQLDSPVFAAVVIFPYLFILGAGVMTAFKEGFSVPRGALYVFIALFGAYLPISCLWSPAPFMSWQFALIVGALPLVFFTLVSRPEKYVYACLAVLGAVMGGYLCWAYWQFFFLYDAYGPRIHHPFMNANDLGAFFVMAALPAAAFFFQARSRLAIIAGFIFFALFTGGVFIAQGRAILLAMFICMGLLIFMLRKAPDMKFRAPMLLLVMLILYVAVDARTGQLYTQTIEALASQGTANMSADSRLLLWKAAIKMGFDHFWGGVGLGNFHYIYPLYRDPRDSSDGYFAHMDPLQFWVEAGIVLPVLFYAVLVLILSRTVKIMRAAPHGSRERALVAGSFCGMFALTAHAHISFNLFQPAHLLPLAVLLSLWQVESEKILNESRVALRFERKPVPVLLSVFGIAILLSGMIWAARAGAGMYYMQKAQALMAQARNAAAEPYVAQAIRWSPDGYSVPFDHMGRLTMLEMSQAPQADKQKLYAEASVLFEKARKRDPYDSFTRLYQGQLYERGFEAGVDPQGREKAKQALRETIHDNPLMMQARLTLSDIYEAEGNRAASIEILQEGMNWPKLMQPISIQYFMRLAGYYREAGNEEMYDFLFKEAKMWNDALVYRAGKK